MKLSMWIIAGLLESFDPEVHIQKESPRVLRSARLAYATDCVYVRQEGKDCLYCWGSDVIRVPDLTAREGFELLQTLFDSMYDWHSQLSEAIEAHDDQRIIDLCHTVFKNPAQLSDANHSNIAMSSQYGPYDVDEEWYHLKTYGCSSIEASRALTKARISYHFSDHIMRYQFDKNFGLLNCLTAPVLHDGMPVAYLTILEKDHSLNYGHMQLLSMITEMMAEFWEQKQPETDEISSMLTLLLEGAPVPGSAMQAFCEQKHWSPEHMYRVIRFEFEQNDQNSSWLREIYFFAASLSAMFPEDLVGIYKGSFYILANDSLLPNKQRRTRLDQQLNIDEVRIASSLPFPGFRHIPQLVDQVDFELDYGVKRRPRMKYLDFYYDAMDYLIRCDYSAVNCLTSCHPDVYALFRSDEILYRTLWVYLVQDRSVTRTIEHLFVHKNTLLYRIRKIEESLTYGISDPYSREYMRMSFTLLERHAGLDNPPETPFPVDKMPQ